MKITKRIIATALTASMALGVCVSSGGACLTGSASKHYDKVVYAYATFNNVPSAKTLTTVESSINKITEKSINVQVVLKPINIFNYTNDISLALQGGDKIDIFESLGNFNTCVSSNMAYNLSKIMKKDAAGTQKLMKPYLAACTKNGKLYGIPTYKPYALTPMVLYKKSIANKLKINMSKVKTVSDLTPILRKVKKAYPSMTPFVPTAQGNSGLILTCPNVDYLSDDYNSPKGVMLNGNKKVVDFYGSSEFSKICKLARTWYNEGLILKDAATTTSTSTELLSSPSSFCYVASYSYPPADTAASIQAQLKGITLGATQIGNAYLDTTSVNSVSWMVSSTSKVPAAALKFLNMTYTNKNIYNLLLYGIKGRDYVLNSSGYMSYPKGKNATSVPYTAALSCGTMGNYFLANPQVGTSKSSYAWEEAQNVKAKKSPAMGFSFDTSSVKTQYTAVNNVIKQYLPGLICGSVDPNTTIKMFRSSLSTAGLNTIISNKQKQLNKWLKSKK